MVRYFVFIYSDGLLYDFTSVKGRLSAAVDGSFMGTAYPSHTLGVF